MSAKGFSSLIYKTRRVAESCAHFDILPLPNERSKLVTAMLIDLVLIAVLAAVPLGLTYVASNPPGRGEPKKRYKIKLGLWCVLAFVVAVCSGKRQLDQKDYPEVAFNDREWEFPYLEANKVNHLRQEVVISSGTARNAQIYIRAFVEHGQPSAELDRQAIVRFKKLIADFPAKPEDFSAKTPHVYDETFQFDKVQLDDLEAGTDTLYAMMDAEWQNKQGFTLKHSWYARMSMPHKNGFVGAMMWHGITQ